MIAKVTTAKATLIDSNTVFEVADSCAAIRIDNAIYHEGTPVTNSASKFIADTLPSPAWANPSFSEDFNIAVDDTTIYKYIRATRTYVSVKNGLTFKKFKLIWSTENRLLVVSWDVTSTSNIREYQINAFV